MGRTGTFLACQGEGVEPDAVALLHVEAAIGAVVGGCRDDRGPVEFAGQHGLDLEGPGDLRTEVPGTDLLTGRRVERGEALHLEPTDVVVLREDRPDPSPATTS